jgi:hypothetical protein
MRTVYHAGTPRQSIPHIYQVGNISPGGLVIRQAATLQATCSRQVACRAFHLSSPSVLHTCTWLVHMALNYSKDRPLAPGVELPTTPLRGDAFLV